MDRTVLPRSLLLFLLGLLASSLVLPGRYGLPWPNPLGPEFTPNVRRIHFDRIAAVRPDLILVGDSVLYLGVDPEVLSKDLERPLYSMGVPGSGSAVWYLILKNVVLDAAPRPRAVVIVFRDSMLTVPTYRTTGRYFEIVDEFAGRREPLLTELAYVGPMHPLERLAEQYLPLYTARWEIREGLDRRLRFALPALFGCPPGCVDEAVNATLGQDRADAVAFNQAVEDAGALLYSREALDFDRQAGRSFLPAMIELAQANAIELVFVRTRTLLHPGSEPAALRTYIDSLETYLAAQEGVHWLDFAHDPRVRDEYFFDSLHFKAEGKAAFTELLAQALQPILGRPASE